MKTEQLHDKAAGLDMRSAREILEILHQSQVDAAKVVGAAIDEIEQGARAMADAVRAGHKLVYAAAGASGTQAMADGLEITPTFGIPIRQVRILRAGGLEDMSRPKGEAEDRVDAAEADAAVIDAGDCVICVAASGNTTYPATILEIAKARGAVTIGMANNPDTTLLTEADIPVLLPTAPEVIAGSTRLGAGTAQKVALNMMSSLMGVLLGHVMDGQMVNVIANNEKLFRRAENIVMHITGCSRAVAADALATAGGSVKPAALLVKGAPDFAAAQGLLDQADQNLRTALGFLDRRDG